jgi:hypothetical protein
MIHLTSLTSRDYLLNFLGYSGSLVPIDGENGNSVQPSTIFTM